MADYRLKKDGKCPVDATCNQEDKFRSLDGSCNNLKNPMFGKVFTPVQRILPNAYKDHIMIPRKAKSGSPLPSARLVSTKLTSVDKKKPSEINTNLLMAIGQFIDHDLVHTPMHGKSIMLWILKI